MLGCNGGGGGIGKFGMMLYYCLGIWFLGNIVLVFVWVFVVIFVGWGIEYWMWGIFFCYDLFDECSIVLSFV